MNEILIYMLLWQSAKYSATGITTSGKKISARCQSGQYHFGNSVA